MTAHPTIDETIAFAVECHAGQRDKAGVPYIAHPLAVMRGVQEPYWHVAVLHDALEDCGVERLQLLDRGYNEDEIAALDLLTRRGDETYESFIERIADSGNATAIIVKLADLADNIDPRRTACLTNAGQDRVRKYERAVRRLNVARDLL